MNKPTTVAGAILAGGLARRMDNRDKGLVLFHGLPLISYPIKALAECASEIIVNANRNLDEYARFGLPVVPDLTENFDGPLAGILTSMSYVDTAVLVVLPCDSPLIERSHIEQLLACRANDDWDIAVASDGNRWHPVFMAVKTELKADLQAFLDSGERKIDRWILRHRHVVADFSATPEIFSNINTLPELIALENRRGSD